LSSDLREEERGCCITQQRGAQNLRIGVFQRARGANGSRPGPGETPAPPPFGCDSTEFELEYLRLPHRHGGPQPLAAGAGKLDKIVQGALGGPDVDTVVPESLRAS